MVRPAPKRDPDGNVQRLALYNPLRLASSLAYRCFVYFFPPATSLKIASSLVPLLVCFALIPPLFLFSLFSGWYIWKNVPVAWQVPVYLQYGDGPSPYAELSLPALSTAQQYDISVKLALPASEANFALGNFMASLTLVTPSNKTLAVVNRPAIVLPPKRAAFWFSTVPRVIDLDVLLLSAYVPLSSNINARIDLGRRDGWKSVGSGEGRELSVSSAALRGALKRRGIWGLVSRFPLTFALGASATFFTLSVMALAACILPVIQWGDPTVHTTASEPEEDKLTRARKRPRRTVVSESRVASSSAHKSEDIPVEIPSAHTSSNTRLRRRRSRMSDVLLDSEG